MTEITDEMVEAAAFALANDYHGDPPITPSAWRKRYTKAFKDRYRRQARVALEAAHNPAHPMKA